MWTREMPAAESRGRVDAVVRAIVVIVCYLIVFAGLLYTAASGATVP